MARVSLVSVCLGSCAEHSMRIGLNSSTGGATSSTALGVCAKALGCGSTALGRGATACGVDATALGQRAMVGDSSTALGQGAYAFGASTALGQGANAGGSFSTALGARVSAGGTNSTVVGYGAVTCDCDTLVLQSAEPCAGSPAKSRIKISGDNISFRINGVCKSMTGSAFFSALGLS